VFQLDRGKAGADSYEGCELIDWLNVSQPLADSGGPPNVDRNSMFKLLFRQKTGSIVVAIDYSCSQKLSHKEKGMLVNIRRFLIKKGGLLLLRDDDFHVESQIPTDVDMIYGVVVSITRDKSTSCALVDDGLDIRRCKLPSDCCCTTGLFGFFKLSDALGAEILEYG